MKRDKLSLINLCLAGFLLTFFLVSFNLTITTFSSKGTVWLSPIVEDGVIVYVEESIWSLVGGCLFVFVLLGVSVANWDRFRFYNRLLVELEKKEVDEP